MGIGDRFRELRKKLGFRQSDFGKIFSLSQDAISAIETGRNKPTIGVLIKLYKDYDVNLGWLLVGDGNMFRNK